MQIYTQTFSADIYSDTLQKLVNSTIIYRIVQTADRSSGPWSFEQVRWGTGLKVFTPLAPLWILCWITEGLRRKMFDLCLLLFCIVSVWYCKIINIMKNRQTFIYSLEINPNILRPNCVERIKSAEWELEGAFISVAFSVVTKPSTLLKTIRTC